LTLYFGLKVNRIFTDISDRYKALANINLDIKDLDKIRGLTDPAGVSRTDLRSLSGLDFDIEKTALALDTDATNYNILTSYCYDERSYIRSDFNINGQLAATSIKYAYLDSTNQANTADISTSRVSAWSSFSIPQVAASPVFYGGTVEVEGNVELTSLTLDIPPVARRFESEIPTHRIMTKIAGVNTYLYAMKGIPLVFKGYFRNLDPIFYISSYNGTALKPSWVIKNDGTTTEYVYRNVSSGNRSAIEFRDSSAAQRTIEFYFPVNNITSIDLNNAGLSEIPKVSLPSLNTLVVNNNDLREFPNLKNFSSLQELRIQNNNLKRAKNSYFTTFSQELVGNNFPSSLKRLYMGNCFDGTFTANLQSTIITHLDLNAGNISNRRLSGTTPSVNSNAIEYYVMNVNLFTNVHSTVTSSTTLKYIDLTDNPIEQNNISFNNATGIERYLLSSGNARTNLVNLSGKTKLEYYISSNMTITTDNNIENIFTGCTNLRYIVMNYTNVAGKFPSLKNCNSLIGIDFYVSNVGSATNDYVLDATTFDACRSVFVYMTWYSPNITDVPFHPNCFRNMSNLDWIWISSQGQGIRGPSPSFVGCPNLSWVIIHWNKQFGYTPEVPNVSPAIRHNMPTMDSNDDLYFYHITWHQFSGAVPNVNKQSLRYLIAYGGLLNQFNKLECTNLIYLHMYYNLIPNIPDLSNLIRLQEVYLHYNRISSYTPGAFATQTSLRILELSNNRFYENTAVNITDQIITDLHANYTASPRGGVYVNLSGNSKPPSNNPNVVGFLANLRSKGWTIITD